MAHWVYWTGDSMAEGLRDGVYGVNSLKLQSLLSGTWRVNNKGVGGDTTAMLLARFNADIMQYGNGEYLIMEIGTSAINQGETLATMSTNVQSMFTTAHNAGMKIIAISTTPSKNYPAWTTDIRDQQLAYNAWLENTASYVDYYIDAYTLLEDPANPDTLLPIYSYDWEHLSWVGWELMGTTVFNTMQSEWISVNAYDLAHTRAFGDKPMYSLPSNAV